LFACLIPIQVGAQEEGEGVRTATIRVSGEKAAIISNGLRRRNLGLLQVYIWVLVLLLCMWKQGNVRYIDGLWTASIAGLMPLKLKQLSLNI
ncbi:MAG: hypothetical protein ACXACA_02435, partial [Candidatus Ranarchaeia archaeon]